MNSSLRVFHRRLHKVQDDQLRPDDHIGLAAVRVSCALLQDAVERLQITHGISERNVHAVRVTIKKVRALLRLIRPLIGEAVFDREDIFLRSTARQLSDIRDISVALRTLHTLKREDTSRHKPRHFRQAAKTLHKRMKKEEVFQNRVVCQVRRDLKICRKRLARTRIKVDETLAIERGLGKTYRACQHRMRAAFSSGQDTDFHRWRIRLKNLYYELQFLAPLWPGRLAVIVGRLKRLQAIVGKDHDLIMLKATIQRKPHNYGRKRTVRYLTRQLRERSCGLRRACQPAAEELLSQKSKIFIKSIAEHRHDRSHHTPPAKSLACRANSTPGHAPARPRRSHIRTIPMNERQT